ncbi:MAG TPA: hypothetical protein VHM90_03080 [Phycisphaerae bacterium]|nr:hypothetical protein [Phycisphaerae bacterium]
MAQRNDNVQARDSSLVPPQNKDLATVVLNDDGVHNVDLSFATLGFIATQLLVRADGPFQWGSDVTQGVGPWHDADTVVAVPVGGQTAMGFTRKNNGGATVNLYIKALGAT